MLSISEKFQSHTVPRHHNIFNTSSRAKKSDIISAKNSILYLLYIYIYIYRITRISTCNIQYTLLQRTPADGFLFPRAKSPQSINVTIKLLHWCFYIFLIYIKVTVISHLTSFLYYTICYCFTKYQ
ncbi:MAG: hypothetical protein ACI8RD_005109 [Bacillariaceae sp.]|jgi:hypothetical protein